MLFKDRSDAGKQLSQELVKFKKDKPVVLSLARGGVPVGFEVAKELDSQLDVIVVRKLGFPLFKELGFGAIAPNNVTVLNNGMVNYFGLDNSQIEMIKSQEEIELLRRLHNYRGNNKMTDLKNKTAIIVDDGVATGITAKAAIKYAKSFKPKKIIMAAPVCAVESINDIKTEVHEVIYLAAPLDFQSVSQWYDNFPQVTDEDVIRLLRGSNSYTLYSPERLLSI